MIAYFKRYFPWAMLALLVSQLIAGYIGLDIVGIQIVTILGIVGWISYIELAQIDTDD